MTEQLTHGYALLLDTEGNYVDILQITPDIRSYTFTGLKPTTAYEVEYHYWTEEIDDG